MTKVILPESGEEIFLGSTKELEADLEVWRKTACDDHPRLEWRRLITSSGGLQIRRQCLDCGYLLGNPRKKQEGDASLPVADRNARERFEDNRRKNYDEILAKHARMQRDRENSWFRDHNEYLAS